MMLKPCLVLSAGDAYHAPTPTILVFMLRCHTSLTGSMTKFLISILVQLLLHPRLQPILTLGPKLNLTFQVRIQTNSPVVYIFIIFYLFPSVWGAKQGCLCKAEDHQEGGYTWRMQRQMQWWGLYLLAVQGIYLKTTIIFFLTCDYCRTTEMLQKESASWMLSISELREVSILV